MKWNALELAGKRFGRLVVISRSENMGSQRAWNCACDCGGSSVVRGSSLKRIDGTRSCGCLIIESQKKAGKSRSGSNHYNWSGGKTEAKDGYIYLSGHVSLTTKTRCALEL